MAEIKAGFMRPWSIRAPTLTRELKTKYVDLFFADGTLRLSSFSAFRNHPDELRRDENEGRISMGINAPNNKMQVLAINGQEVYILCASTVEKANVANTEYSSFRIIDSLRFADAISRQIPGFIGGMEGLCYYRDDTFLKKQDTYVMTPPIDEVSMEQWAAEQDERIRVHANDAFFLKHSRFAHESEYRFIWFADGLHKDFIEIKCPEARLFCERIVLSEPNT